jgi:hypothetical protein
MELLRGRRVNHPFDFANPVGWESPLPSVLVNQVFIPSIIKISFRFKPIQIQ